MATYVPTLLHTNVEVTKILQTSPEKTVYLVSDNQGKPLVLKVYQATYVWMYKYEVQVLTNFESESVGYPLMTSHKTLERQHEILMKYHGKSLEEHILLGSKPLTHFKILQYLYNLVDLLEVLHKFGYAHGNLKLNNIAIN